jgi:hypothetical protein
MAMQQSSVSTLSPAETDVESNHQAQISESATLHSLESRLSEKKDGATKTGPVSSALDAGEFPDGGLVAWLVVLGVSRLSFPLSLLFLQIS